MGARTQPLLGHPTHWSVVYYSALKDCHRPSWWISLALDKVVDHLPRVFSSLSPTLPTDRLIPVSAKCSMDLI